MNQSRIRAREAPTHRERDRQTERERGLDDDVRVVELLVRGQLDLGWIDEVPVDDDLALGLALADQQVSLAVLPVVESCGGKQERESENSLKTSNCTPRKASNQHGASS